MRVRALLRLYPRAWRERYGDEFVALLESRPLTIAGVLNIAGAACRERAAAMALPTSWPEATMPLVILTVALATPAIVSRTAAIVFARYGASPAFQQTFTRVGEQLLCTPAPIVRFGSWLIMPMLAVLVRSAAAGWWVVEWGTRTKVRTLEFALWLPLLVAVEAARTVIAHAGSCSVVSFDRGWIEQAAPVLNASMLLWSASRESQRVRQRARDRRSQPPRSFGPLGLS